MRHTKIIVFAKAPLPGLAKTRLIPALGAEGAATLARRMLERTVAMAARAGAGMVELCVSPRPSHPVWNSLALPGCVFWSDQGHGDLGARMARAVRRATRDGHAVLLIGTDCPQMDAADLQRAAFALRSHDCGIVPVADGGYVALGLKRFHPAPFEEMPWSTGAVAAETLRRLGRLGWKTHVGRTLHDIDEPPDLAWLPADFGFQVPGFEFQVRAAPAT
ncbi:MAG TPA: glycosyltransferase [Rhodocyclaceae bacterium]|nr:MAG: hypothetical protein CO164_13540 [Rhodocyclales bacterium CG_4_9_14_3_um_filter_68_10]HCX32492.1 glycosyltransferase [Rhodocyclaceae bacterium]